MRSKLLFSLKILLFLLLLAKCPIVHAVDLNECGNKLRGEQSPAWNGTQSSIPTPPPPPPPTPLPPTPPFELTYQRCLFECGRGFGSISWCVFSQSVITWFIPWVVLGFQIPFCATDPFDDVCAFFLTLGSPALAAYSLQITQLNARWLTQVFSDIDYPASMGIPTVVSALQHTPIQLSTNPTLLPSLIVLPQNGAYWRILLKSAKKIRRWSIPIIVNFVWIIISALLTIIGTFYAPVPGEIGYGAVASLVYLLPLTIGWLYVGSEPESNHLRDSLEEANSVAFVATNRGGEPVLAESLVGQPNRAIEFVKRCDVDLARKDESKANPIFNYSRTFVWSQIAEVIYTMARNAAVRAEGVASIHRPSSGPEVEVTTKGRSWTAYEVIGYCATENFEELSRWATGAWKRTALAAGLALGLQWGTTGAGLFIYYEMRPVGLGCRTTALLIYGILGTLSFLLLLASSILAQISRPRPGSRHRYSKLRFFQEAAAVLSRWLGKILGVIAGFWILVISLIQPLGFFNNCWCSSMTFDRAPQNVAFMMGGFVSQWEVCKDLVGGLALAFVTVSFFGFSIYLGTPRKR